MIGMLRSETIRLSIGPPDAVNDVHAAFVMKINEKLAETAYEAMCNGNSTVKDCFDQACHFFTRAIGLAKYARLDDEVARLTARLDHVVGVYNSLPARAERTL
jgi:hypothetical protein